MLDAVTTSALAGLMLEARRVVEGVYSGGHASPWRGWGYEFHDYRPFVPGDNPRSVDWKLWGRTDRLYVKRFRQRTDLHVTLLVDASASMHFAGLDRRGRAIVTTKEKPTKLAYARLLAAAMAFIVVRQGDRVGLSVLANRIVNHLPAGGSWAHLQRLGTMLETAAPVPGEGRLGEALRHAHALERRRGLVVLISDLLDEPAPVLDSLSRFRHDGFDVAVLQVLTPQEIDVATVGDHRLKMVDIETRAAVSTSLGSIGGRYRELMAAHIDALRRGCLGLGADYELATTDEAPTAVLRRWLGRRSQSRA